MKYLGILKLSDPNNATNPEGIASINIFDVLFNDQILKVEVLFSRERVFFKSKNKIQKK